MNLLQGKYEYKGTITASVEFDYFPFQIFDKTRDTLSLVERAYIGEKSRRMQMRRKNLERRQNREIEEKSTLLKNIETTEELKLFP